MENNTLSNIEEDNIVPSDINNDSFKLGDDTINLNNIQNNNTENNNNENNTTEEIKEDETPIQEKTILKLNVSKWGIVSAIANFTSVIFQLYKTIKTEKVKSFSMKFIALMTFLNFVYVILGILTENHGMTFACLVFVIYNLIIVYYYYFGKK